VTRPKDLAASVKQRLLDRARQQHEDFGRLLARYGVERFLFRLSQSEHSQEFVLKGASLFYVWSAAPHRPTRDLDFLGYGPPEPAWLESVLAAVCSTIVAEDGLVFLPESVSAERIREGTDYGGIRAKLVAQLGSARISLQIDVGFGDAIVPPPEMVVFPVLLEQPAPRLRACHRDTVVAEKLQIMVELGIANSRMKDFFDLRFLAATFDFQGPRLTQAIEATFRRRHTPLPADAPTGLTDEFVRDKAKQIQWQGFLRRSGLERAAPDLSRTIVELREFLLPPLAALASGKPFDLAWTAFGPWHPGEDKS